jgi:hypothetical protein
MDSPNVLNVLNEPARNIRFEVLAYRKLTEQELYSAVQTGISLMKRKPKKNSKYTFVTVLGFND